TEIREKSWRERFADEFGMGFTAPIAKHHCHAGHRFPTTVICGDCNSADGRAKRQLMLPESWSFSPDELARFVSVRPHSGKTEIDYEIAWSLYQRAVQT